MLPRLTNEKSVFSVKKGLSLSFLLLSFEQEYVRTIKSCILLSFADYLRNKLKHIVCESVNCFATNKRQEKTCVSAQVLILI